MTTAQKPDALPVVAHLLEESRRWKARALTTTDRAMAEREAQARNDGSTVSALVRLSDAQASLLAKEAECEALKKSRDALSDMYQQLAEAMGYHSGENGMEFSPEEFAAALKLKAARYDWLRDPKRCEALGKEPYVGIEDDDAHPNHWALTGEKADAAIDADRAAADQGGAP